MELTVQAGIQAQVSERDVVEVTMQSDQEFEMTEAGAAFCMLPGHISWHTAHFSMAKLIDGEFVFGNPSTEPVYAKGESLAAGNVPVGRRVALDSPGRYRVRHTWFRYRTAGLPATNAEVKDA